MVVHICHFHLQYTFSFAISSPKISMKYYNVAITTIRLDWTKQRNQFEVFLTHKQLRVYLLVSEAKSFVQAASDDVKESISCKKRKESVKLVHNALWIQNEVKQGTLKHSLLYWNKIFSSIHYLRRYVHYIQLWHAERRCLSLNSWQRVQWGDSCFNKLEKVLCSCRPSYSSTCWDVEFRVHVTWSWN